MSPDQAVQELVNHNDRVISSPSDKEVEAIRRLHSAVGKARAGNADSGAEIVLRLVKDFDVVFYGGVLSGHIDVCWGSQLAFWIENLHPNQALG